MEEVSLSLGSDAAVKAGGPISPIQLLCAQVAGHLFEGK
jgi:hypothetical protein